MIPRHLSLKNFLSYREASLNFSGLHTACICGPNGSGKSSLLEAIAWAVWGNSRAATEDDLIHMGEIEMQVDFIFVSHCILYRIIRNRRRNQVGTLEFQVATNSIQVIEQNQVAQFRALTERGMRATQQKIQDALKLDYDTFINSAYLRQGRADEFMLKRPTDRKEILASLLKLDEYEVLAERAKDLSKHYKGQLESLQQTLTSIQAQLQRRDSIDLEIAQLEANFHDLQTLQASDQTQLQGLQTQHHDRQTWVQFREQDQHQHQAIVQEQQRWQQELNITQQHLIELQGILQQETQIRAGFSQLQRLQTAEETLAKKLKIHQDTTTQHQHLQNQQQQQAYALQQQIQTITARLEALRQQETEYAEVLQHQSEISKGLAQLQIARDRLNHLDQLHLQVTPLLQHRQQLQTQLDRLQARQSARLEEVSALIKQLHQNLQGKSKLHHQFKEVGERIAELEKKQTYQQQVLEKGQERRSFIDSLNHRQQDHEGLLAELNQKVALLEAPTRTNTEGEVTLAIPQCPLCDRPLDDHHLRLVIRKHRHQQKTIRDQIWVINEQLAASEQEIQVLREEYRHLDRELSHYDTWRERRGEVQAQLAALDQQSIQLNQLKSEAATLARSLQTGDYAPELHTDLKSLDQQIQALDYHDQTHALARNEEKRWRWAEIKQSHLREAKTKLTRIQAQKPELEAQLTTLNNQLTQLQTDSDLQCQIVALQHRLDQINYSFDEHTRIRSALRQAQQFLAQVDKLNTAQEQLPKLQQRFTEIQQGMQQRSQDLQTVQTQINQWDQKLQQTSDPAAHLQTLEDQIQQRRRQMDAVLSQLGSLKQQKANLETLNTESQDKLEHLTTLRRQLRIHQELAQAFGKNGIQALMIENVLPQLEVESNHILARLSASQLHVQFVTQRTGRSSRSAKKTAKLIDTLEILIADIQGTRPYETYSGGEAFRINFAIRLALAKLLAQRAGAALQLLIIDEGFGTQDAEGCDRLIAAINAIAHEFACILTVTHIPYLKEAFQARIEVRKTDQGSQLRLSV
ncbi:MAG: AAA family ATPase [Microcoleaceae cyanobacterium]